MLFVHYSKKINEHPRILSPASLSPRRHDFFRLFLSSNFSETSSLIHAFIKHGCFLSDSVFQTDGESVSEYQVSSTRGNTP